MKEVHPIQKTYKKKEVHHPIQKTYKKTYKKKEVHHPIQKTYKKKEMKEVYPIGRVERVYEVIVPHISVMIPCASRDGRFRNLSHFNSFSV